MNPVPIIYENQEIIIINKKQGIAVQGGKNVSHPLDRELPLQLGYPVFLVHRLDQETGGLLIVAKSPVAAKKWTLLIGGKTVKKEYDALCIGIPQEKKGQLKTAVIEHGIEKSALTYYEVIQSWKTGIYEMSHIHLTLATAGFPIVADDKYGNFKANKELKKLCGIKRLQLFSSKLTIPSTGSKSMTFTIPVNFAPYFEQE